jgi:hypothetical protein
MAKLIFITPQEMTQTTLIGGNVDTDKYTMCILNTQIRIIEPLLGSELYEKLITDLTPSKYLLQDGNENVINNGNNLIISTLHTADLVEPYRSLFFDYVKPITKYEAVADYIAISPYTLTNGGLFKNSPENVEVVTKKETDALSERYSSIAQTYVDRFEKFIELNKDNIPEYKRDQDKVNAIDVNVNNGWYMPKSGY